jgi:hypothetical protein
MGFLGNLFSGRSGMGWKASGTDIAQPTTTGQARDVYGQTQQGLRQQQDFLTALQGQGGLANQSSVFNQQQNLADLMQGVATGTGPNPALAGLNKSTGQNIAAMTSAMAGARGASANPAAIARSAGRAGAESLQTAAADAATLQAQQQIAGMDALSRQQQAMAGMSNQQVANQAAATKDYSTSAQNLQQNLLASINAQNQANVAMQSNINNANAGIQQQIAQNQGGLFAKAAGAVSGALPLPFMAALGGRVPRYADGGDIQRTNLPQIDTPYNIDVGSPTGIDSDPDKFSKDFDEGKKFGSALKDKFSSSPSKMPELGSSFKAKQNASISTPFSLGVAPSTPGPSRTGLGVDTNLGAPMAQPTFAEGGKVPALVSPGEKYLSPEQAQDVLKGKENPMNGKTIPGKAKVKGDSYENDTVPVTLEEGGCVIPRSVLQSDQPMKNAIKFVHAHMKKMAKGGKVDNKKQESVEQTTQSGEKPFVHPEMQKQVLNESHVLFSPSNALHPVSLKMTPDEVLDFVKSHGFVAEPAIGAYEGTREPSIMVHNVPRGKLPFLFDLAKQLGQDSIIHSEGGHHEAHYLNGPNEGKVARGFGTAIHEKEPDDFYTKTKNGLVFSHNIVWDKLYDK